MSHYFGGKSLEDDATRYAASRAAREPGESFTVYRTPHAFHVCAKGDPKPDGATMHCIAQQWDATTVQLRFAGARSEWIKT
jgi:hypothetical protein